MAKVQNQPECSSKRKHQPPASSSSAIRKLLKILHLNSQKKESDFFLWTQRAHTLAKKMYCVSYIVIISRLLATCHFSMAFTQSGFKRNWQFHVECHIRISTGSTSFFLTFFFVEKELDNELNKLKTLTSESEQVCQSQTSHCSLKPFHSQEWSTSIFNFFLQFLTRNVIVSKKNLAFDTVPWLLILYLNFQFSLHHSYIFFWKGCENLYSELGSERVKWFPFFLSFLNQLSE